MDPHDPLRGLRPVEPTSRVTAAPPRAAAARYRSGCGRPSGPMPR